VIILKRSKWKKKKPLKRYELLNCTLNANIKFTKLQLQIATRVKFIPRFGYMCRKKRYLAETTMRFDGAKNCSTQNDNYTNNFVLCHPHVVHSAARERSLTLPPIVSGPETQVRWWQTGSTANSERVISLSPFYMQKIYVSYIYC